MNYQSVVFCITVAFVAIIVAIPNNFTTYTLKAYLSTQPSSLSAFMISKTHIVDQKPCRRQLNAKVCGCDNAIFVIFLVKLDHCVQQRYLENGLSTHRHFCTKLMHITAQNSTTTQCLHSFIFFTLQLKQFTIVARTEVQQT